MDSDAGESGGEDLDTKFSNNKKTKNDRAEQNKVVIDKKQIGKLLIGQLRTATVSNNGLNDISKMPMKLATNAKDREKNLANMVRFTASKVDSGNPNARKPPQPRSNNSKSPMPTAKRDLKHESVSTKKLNNNNGSTQKTLLIPNKTIASQQSMKVNNDSETDEKHAKKNNNHYSHSRTTLNEDNTRDQMKRTTNQFIFDIPELEDLEEDEPNKRSTKFGKIKPMQLSQNSDINSDSYQNSAASRNNSNMNSSNFQTNISNSDLMNSNDTNKKKSNKNKYTSDSSDHENINENSETTDNSSVPVNRLKLFTLQTEEDLQDLDSISKRDAHNLF